MLYLGRRLLLRNAMRLLVLPNKIHFIKLKCGEHQQRGASAHVSEKLQDSITMYCAYHVAGKMYKKTRT